jgi:hypothetical protein
VPEVQKQLRAAAANVTAAFYRDARKGVS